MSTSAEKYAEAEKLGEQAAGLRREAHELHLQEGRARPLGERLVYAATSRCKCGAGLAYDPFGASGGHPEEGENDSPFKGVFSGWWDCSAILLGTADTQQTHTGQLPFSSYEVKSENQPSAGGATTRPK
jgi:hypothetical protein